MERQKYTHIKELGNEIAQMINEGKSQRQIAEFFGFKNKTVVHQYLKRQRRKQERLESGILPRRRGRPAKGHISSEQEKDNEIDRLKMEIKLLRSFLQFAGRR